MRAESIRIGLTIFAVIFGRIFFVKRPSRIGIINIIKIALNTSQGFKEIVFNVVSTGGYKFPQKKKLNGVIKIASADENAVSEMERAVLPFASRVIKFEMLPPGQAATKSIPSAIPGEGFKIQRSK